MEEEPDASGVWSGCFGGPPRASAAGDVKHIRTNSKTSLSLSRWWNNSNTVDGLDAEQALASDQDGMLAQLADDLLGLSDDPAKAAAAAPQAASVHERKLSWPFGTSRRVAPHSGEAPAPEGDDDNSIELPSFPASEVAESPSSAAGEGFSPRLPSPEKAPQADAADAEAARPQGYRRLWQSITSVRKGDRVAAPPAAAASQEYTVESLSRGVLALKPSQPIMESHRLAAGLQALDSRAVAALLKELAKSGAPHRASELFDYLRSLPEEHELAHLADLYTYTTVISQCGGHQHLR